MTTGLATGTYELFVGIDIAATTAEVATQRPGAKARKSGLDQRVGHFRLAVVD